VLTSVLFGGVLIYINPLAPKNSLADMQFDAEKTESHLNLSVKNMQSNAWPFKFPVFADCTGHWILAPKC